MRLSSFRALMALALLLAPGCFDNFDPALYMGGTDAGIDAPMEMLDAPADDVPPIDGGFTLTYGDECTGLAVSNIPMGVSAFPINTLSSNDTFRALDECVGADTPGNDVFVAVSAMAGERWHFHVRPSVDSNVNAVLYLLNGCNEMNCSPDRSVNACGQNQFEHLSVVAPTTGTFTLGIDTTSTGGFSGNLEIYRPICGNGGGAPEHSEGCDDGNTMSGDGCDSLCRVELDADARTEMGANDDHFSANHVLDADGATVLGSIGAGCDVDFYAVDVAAGQTMTAVISRRGSGACQATAPEVRLSILDDDGYTELEVVDPSEQCPTLARTFASAGTYFVRLTAPDGGASWDYDLDIDLSP